MDRQPLLHLIMGLPGAGKTTLAKKIAALTGARRLSSDEYRVQIFEEPCFSQEEHDHLYGILDHNVEHLLAAGYDVVYDANVNRLQHRQEKYQLAKKYNARVYLWWVQTSRELAKARRVAEQDAILLPKGESSENMFERIAAIIEEPDESEPVKKIKGADITAEAIKKHL